MTIIKKFELEGPKKSFGKKYIIVTGMIFLMLIVTQIWVNNSVVTYGEKYEKLLRLEKTLSLENQVLENRIAKNASLQNVASRSSELGFSQPESIQYIR